MNTENLSTLKIHKLTQEQYDRELAAGRIDENALYLTPYEETDLSEYATQEYVDDALTGKQPVGDYALKSEIPTDYLTEIPSEYVTGTELNAKGYLTSYTETDPTVPAWAKASSKPSYMHGVTSYSISDGIISLRNKYNSAGKYCNSLFLINNNGDLTVTMSQSFSGGSNN